jgi:hypothetical protein
MSRVTRLDRRTLLRGAGALVALPFLEAMTAPRGLALTMRADAPRRMVFVYVPNGVHMPAWRPTTTGADYVLPATLEPLAPFRDSLLVLSGLVHDKARANGDGPGDHARASAAFLTGCQPFKTDGTAIRAGVSVDQVAAARVGTATRLRSLEIGIEGGAQSGQCDSGYACAYSSNLSWSTPHTPNPKETDPRLVFDRLFRDGDENETPEARALRLKRRASILDWVRDDARALQGRLGSADRRKLDEYLTAVRELERRIEASASGVGSGVPDSARPPAAPADYAEHIRLQSDLLVLALRTDTTRIATFSYANEGSNRSYAFLGVPEGHHDISHHGNDQGKLAKIQLVNHFHVKQLAYLLTKLRESQEGEGDLLANSMIVYGSGISDGNRHNHDDLPLLLAGRGGGRVASGRHVQVAKDTPVANLFVTMLEKMDVSVARHGDSTGKLDLS